MSAMARIGSALLRRAKARMARLGFVAARAGRPPLVGQFQPYNHTLPDRYPWLFQFAARELGDRGNVHILSFGCSEGEEVFALAKYFPDATIRGIDIDPGNIARCRTRGREGSWERLTFAEASTTQAEPSSSYDALFCLAVLCNGDLTNSGAKRCDPVITFDAFERIVTDFARCLKPGGLLFLHTANFRFCDTAISDEFDVVLKAEPSRLAKDVLFDRGNRLMRNIRYHDIGFRRRSIEVEGRVTGPAAAQDDRKFDYRLGYRFLAASC
jgi:SAM-dependent methyltransferase